jgi:hypothetical protein
VLGDSLSLLGITRNFSLGNLGFSIIWLFSKMQPEIVPEIPNTRHFEYPKCRVRVSGNPVYPISMLLIVKRRSKPR